MLLLADWVIPVSSAPLADAGVRVANGRIVEVGPAAQLRARSEGEEIRTFPGCALLPGFINSHSHLELSAFRGFSRPSSFGRWMLNFLLARRKLDRPDFEASALWGAYECARCGITSVADTAFDGLAVVRAAGGAGLRARVYQEVFGLDDATLPQTMGRFEEVLRRLQEEAAAAPLVEAGVSPHAPYTVSQRLYREAARFARRAGLRLATHVAESQAEVELLARGTGSIARAHRLTQLWAGIPWSPPHVRPIEYVSLAGALGPETLVIHAVEVNREEVGVLAASGAAVAHCPRSNARLRCGVAPVAEFLAAGVSVGLGTDSLASNDSLDMFAEMRAALTASGMRAAGAAETGAPERHAGLAGLPSALTAETVLRMATLEGARALGWGQLTGSLDPGKSADVIAVRLPVADPPSAAGPQPSGLPWPGRTAGLVPAVVARGKVGDVRMTMAAGRVVFEGGSPVAEALSGYRTARQKLGLKG